jgi:hypothetical protein
MVEGGEEAVEDYHSSRKASPIVMNSDSDLVFGSSRIIPFFAFRDCEKS